MEIETGDPVLDERLPRILPGTFFEVLGLRMTASDPNRITGELYVEERHLNPGGQVHGGVIAGMADSLAGVGAQRNLPEPARSFATIEMKVNLMGSARAGDTVSGVATPMHLGRTTQVWDVAIFNRARSEKPIGLFRCTQAVLT